MRAARRILTICAAAMLAGCGGYATLPLGTARTDPAAEASVAKNGGRFIYVANGDEVLVFPERLHDPRPVARITDGIAGASGLSVDRHGNLYVANGNQTVTVYRPGSTSPFATYAGGGSLRYPVADHDGNVFATSTNGSVVEWLRDRTAAPYRTLQTPGYEADGLAFDVRGALYVTYRTSLNSGGLVTFARGSSNGRVLGIRIIQPQGLAIASDGTILVVQTGGAGADGVYAFRPGTQRPWTKVAVDEIPVEVALTRVEHKVFVSADGYLGSARIYQAPYPFVQGARFHTKIVFRLRRNGHRRRHRFEVWGMAVSNAEAF